MLAYLMMSWSGSMFAHAYRSGLLLGLNKTIERPTAETSPSRGKLLSTSTDLLSPTSIVPTLEETSPT